jgi:hypothetical protein
MQIINGIRTFSISSLPGISLSRSWKEWQNHDLPTVTKVLLSASWLVLGSAIRALSQISGAYSLIRIMESALNDDD